MKKSTLLALSALVLGGAAIATAAVATSSAPEKVIFPGQSTLKYDLTPADGSTVETLGFTIVFQNVESFEPDYNVAWKAEWYPKVTEVEADPEAPDASTEVEPTEITGSFVANPVTNGLSFSLMRGGTGGVDLTTGGTLKVTFESGYFVVNGNKSKKIEFSYNVDPEEVNPPVGESKTIKELLGDAGEVDPALGTIFDDKLGDGLPGMYMFLLDCFNLTRNPQGAADATFTKPDGSVITLPEKDYYTEVEETYTGPVWAIDESDDYGIFEVLFSYDSFTAPGVYTLNFPDGFFLAEGAPIKASSFKYYVGMGTMTPADGTEIDLADTTPNYVTSKNAWNRVDFTPYAGLTINESEDIKFQIKKDGQVLEAQDQPSSWFSLYKGNVPMTFNGAGLTEPGEYTVCLPAGFFTNEDGVLSPAKEYNFTVKNSNLVAPELTYTMTPEPGAYEKWPVVRISYENTTGDLVLVDADAKATIHRGNLEQAAIAECALTVEGNTLVVTVVGDEPQYNGNAYTTYLLHIPAGVVNVPMKGATLANEEMTITDYKMASPKCPDAVMYDPENAATGKSDDFTLITFKVADVSRINSTKFAKLYLVENGQRSSEVAASYQFALLTDKSGFTLKRMNATSVVTLPDGMYELVVPAAGYYCLVNNIQLTSTEQVFSFNISSVGTGVEGVDAETSYTVYTVTGACVVANGTAADVKNLAKGLYIVNGKKVLVK